jgi:hypothetical protein
VAQEKDAPGVDFRSLPEKGGGWAANAISKVNTFTGYDLNVIGSSSPARLTL